MTRVSFWEHIDGFDAGVASLAAVLQPFAMSLASMGTDVYTSDCFKTGFDQRLLEKHSDMASGLMKVDSRGGLFSQRLVFSALRRVLLAEDVDPVLVKSTLDSGHDKDAVIQVMAYRLRMLLGHYRATFDNGAEDENLNNVFCLMNGDKGPTWSTAKQSRRAKRLAQRPHPFRNYQSSCTDNESSEEAPPSYFEHVHKLGRGSLKARWIDEQCRRLQRRRRQWRRQ